MRILGIAGILLVAALLSPALPATADPAGDLNLSWQAFDDGDAEDPLAVVELGLGVAGLEPDLGLIVAPRCRPMTQPATKHAYIEYRDASGLPMYTFFHDVTFRANCKTVTLLSRSVRYEIYQPQYSFAGYVQNSTTPNNRAVVTSSAQGRFGVCQHVAGSTCVLERQPSITWRVDATGRATVKQTP